MTQPPDEQRIARLAQKMIPGGKLLRACRLSGGISAQMTAFELLLPDGQRQKMILRQPGGNAYRQNPAAAAQFEYSTLQAAHHLELAAPAPLHFEPGGEIFPLPCFVMEYIDGSPQYAPPDRVDFAHQAAAHLARIHSAEVAHLDLSFLPHAPSGCAEISSRPAENPVEALGESEIRRALQAVSPAPRRNRSVLLHGDYWPGNLLWRGERLVAVVDWEDAALGDPLIDLSISRLDMLWIMGEDAMRALTARYQSLMAIDYACLPYWDLCAALRLIRLAGASLEEWAAFFHPFGRRDITAQTMQGHLEKFIRQALDQLARCRISTL